MSGDDDFQDTRSRKRPRQSKRRDYACPAKGIVPCDIRVDNRGVCEDHSDGLLVDFDRCRLCLVTEFPNQRYRKLELAGRKAVAFRTFAYAFDEWALIVFELQSEALAAEKFMSEHYKRQSEKHLHLLPLSTGETLPRYCAWKDGLVRFVLDKNERKFRPHKLLDKWREADSENKCDHLDSPTSLSSPLLPPLIDSDSRSRSRSADRTVPQRSPSPMPALFKTMSSDDADATLEASLKQMSHYIQGLQQVQRQLGRLSLRSTATSKQNPEESTATIPPSTLKSLSRGNVATPVPGPTQLSASMGDDALANISPQQQQAAIVQQQILLMQQKQLVQYRERELLRRKQLLLQHQHQKALARSETLSPNQHTSSPSPLHVNLENTPRKIFSLGTTPVTSSSMSSFISVPSIFDNSALDVAGFSTSHGSPTTASLSAASASSLANNANSSSAFSIGTGSETTDAIAMGGIGPPMGRSESLGTDSALHLDSVGLAASTTSVPQFTHQMSISSLTSGSRHSNGELPPFFTTDLNLQEMDLYIPTSPEVVETPSPASHSSMRLPMVSLANEFYDKATRGDVVDLQPTSICSPLVRRITAKATSRLLTSNLFSRLQNAVSSWWSTYEVVCHADQNAFRMYIPGTMRPGVDAMSSAEGFSLNSVKNVSAMPAPDTTVFRVTVEKSNTAKSIDSQDLPPGSDTVKSQVADRSDASERDLGGEGSPRNVKEHVYEFVAATEADRDRWVSFLQQRVKQ